MGLTLGAVITAIGPVIAAIAESVKVAVYAASAAAAIPAVGGNTPNPPKIT